MNARACRCMPAVLSAAACATLASAAETTSESQRPLDPGDGLETITITATRTQRSLFDLPETVSRVDSREIERFMAQSLSDVLESVPGVNFTGGPRAIAEEPNIRGLGGTRILITVDGARQDFDSAHKGRVFMETDLLKAVEVLRGPGSAVYGSGAMGGVIAMTTKDAADLLEDEERIGVRLKAGYQDVNTDRDGTGMIFGVLDRLGGFDYLFSATRRSSDDVRLGGGEILEDSAEDTWAGLGKITWTPGPKHRVALSSQYTFQSGEVPAQADAETSPTAVLTARETETTLDRIGYDFGEAGAAFAPSAFAYKNRQTIREQRIGTDGRLDIIHMDTIGVDAHNSTEFAAGPRLDHRLTYGVETYRDEMSSQRGQEPNLAFPAATADFVGVYVQDEIALSPWVLIPGVRYDSYESRPDDPTDGSVAERTEADRVSPKLGVLYGVTEWLNLSLSYAQAFRAPDFQELYISGSHFGANEFVPNPDLKPERLTDSVEAGVRIARDTPDAGDRWWLRASAYRNEYKDFIDSVVTVTTTSFDNISSARIKGIELEASYYLRRWNVEATAGASHAVGDRLSTGEPLSSIPGDSYTLELRKAIPRAGVSLSWRGRFNARQDRVAAGQPETPAYDVHDIFASWTPQVARMRELTLTLGVDNLADEAYRPHLSQLEAPGRNVKLGFTAQF